MEGTIHHHDVHEGDGTGDNGWEEDYPYNTGTRIAITLGFNMSK
jgi:hypothetical protein